MAKIWETIKLRFNIGEYSRADLSLKDIKKIVTMAYEAGKKESNG